MASSPLSCLAIPSAPLSSSSASRAARRRQSRGGAFDGEKARAPMRRYAHGHEHTRAAVRAASPSSSGSSSLPSTPSDDDDGSPSLEPSFVKRVPPGGDERERDVCSTCGFVDYKNPKVVVGCLPIWVRHQHASTLSTTTRTVFPRFSSTSRFFLREGKFMRVHDSFNCITCRHPLP